MRKVFVLLALGAGLASCSLLLDDGYSDGVGSPIADAGGDTVVPINPITEAGSEAAADATVCTADIARDPLNCGVCGRSCNGATCTDGQCESTLLAKIPSPTCIAIDGAFAYAANGALLFYVQKSGGELTPYGRDGGSHGGAPHHCVVSAEALFAAVGGYVGKSDRRGGDFGYFAFGGGANPDVRAVTVSEGLVYATFVNGAIGSCPVSGCLLGDTNQSVTPVASGEGDPAGITATKTTLTWTNRTAGTVRQLALVPGATPVTVASAQDAPTDIVDSNGDLFWINQAGAIMKRAAGVGSTPTVLVSVTEKPQSLAVDDANVYWVSATTAGAIMRVARNGGPAIVVARATSPLGLAVDGTSVYWVTAGTTGELRRAPK